MDAAMQNGLLPGALSLAGNFWPAIKAVSEGTCLPLVCCIDAVRHHLAIRLGARVCSMSYLDQLAWQQILSETTACCCLS